MGVSTVAQMQQVAVRQTIVRAFSAKTGGGDEVSCCC